MYYIGIDLGTSAMKLLLMDAAGKIHNTVIREYPLEFPQPGWSQQNPEDWKKALMEGVPELLNGFDASEVAGIGAGGQMHGLVVLDENNNVIADRYSSYNSGIGAKIRSGETTLEELAAYAENMGTPELPGSGRQEYLEAIVNNIMFLN